MECGTDGRASTRGAEYPLSTSGCSHTLQAAKRVHASHHDGVDSVSRSRPCPQPVSSPAIPYFQKVTCRFFDPARRFPTGHARSGFLASSRTGERAHNPIGKFDSSGPDRAVKCAAKYIIERIHYVKNTTVFWTQNKRICWRK